ncbi:MAG: TolC family protein [Bacteroidota bacterium]
MFAQLIKTWLLCCCLAIPSISVKGQANYTLEGLVQIAKENSPFALQAETQKENRYWEWRTFRSNYKLQLSLRGTLPDFDRSVTPIRQPDGGFVFRRTFNNLSGLSLQLGQSIPWTGGEVFLESILYRFDDFSRKDDMGNNLRQYSHTPARVRIFQPLFGFNSLKWDKRTEPLRYQESQRAYVADIEDIALQTTQFFFQVLLAQVNFEIAQTNVANSDTIFRIAEVKHEMGRLPRKDLLQLKLNRMNAEKNRAQAELDLQEAKFDLGSYVGLSSEEAYSLDIPNFIPEVNVTEAGALTQARENRAEVLAFKRRRIEAEATVAQAKASNGLQADLNATLGWANEAPEFSEIYNGVQDQQTISIQLSIPILDWGRSKARINTALANQKLVNFTVDQDERNFDQEVLTLVRQFRSLYQQLEITRLSDEIARENYTIAQARYLKGASSITDLNLAIQEQNNARSSYITSLRSFWTNYYRLRILTLFDFERNESLIASE